MSTKLNCIEGITVNMIDSSVVNRGFESWLGQTHDH